MSGSSVREICSQKLGLDQACLEINSNVPYDVNLWHQFQECVGCDETLWAKVPGNGSVSLLVNTAYPSYFLYTNDKGIQYCLTHENFEEHGVYGWNISDGSCSSVWKIKGPTTHFYLPLVIALVVLGLCSVLLCLIKCICKQEWASRIWVLNLSFSELESGSKETSPVKKCQEESTTRLRKAVPKILKILDLGSPLVRESSPVVSRVGSTRRQVTTRLESLDTLRGICISMMIFVNYGGGSYLFFRHTPWNGMTVADIIFPWFLWVMGVSLVLSLRSKLRSDRSRCSVWLSVLRRALMLILIGLLLNSFDHHNNDLSKIRFGGVLQRIGMSFLIVASVETVFIKLQCSSQYGLFLDLWDGWPQWLCGLVVAGLWAAITFLVEVPECGRGYLGPGGLHQHGNFSNCTGGAAGYLDHMILQANHMYQHPTCEKIYKSSMPYDPEGLLGTLTAAFLVYLGVNAGRVMLCHEYTGSRISRWIFWGALCTIVGGMLCGFSKEMGTIPINKNLFSLSFVLVTGGLAYFAFTALYIIIDYKGWWSGTPFSYAGMNSILVYVGHEVTKGMFPFSWKPKYGTHTELLGMNMIGTFLWLFIAYQLYRKQIFIRI